MAATTAPADREGAARSGSTSGPAPASSLDHALLGLAGRIESVLAEERQLLSGGPAEDLDRIAARKNLLALEATRLTQHAGALAPSPAVTARLRDVAAALADNERLLKRHIDAVSEIAALVADVCSRASSDGTYTKQAARQGPMP